MRNDSNTSQSFMMSEIGKVKILNQLSETEIKEENWSVKARDNICKLWNRDNEILQERLNKVEKGKNFIILVFSRRSFPVF